MANRKVRRDPQGRILLEGEYWDKSKGRYKFVYTDKDGKPHTVYSHRLVESDPMPENAQKYCRALRDIERDFEDNRHKSGNFYDKTTVTIDKLYENCCEKYWSNPRLRKPATYIQYVQTYEKHIKPVFGKRRAAEVETYEIKDFLLGLYNSGQLKKSSVYGVKKVFNLLYKLNNDGRINCDNPLENMKLPFPNNDDDDEEDENGKSLTEDEQKILTDLLKKDGSVTALAVLAQLTSGMRVGEICALRWDDIDRDKNTVRVDETSHYSKQKPTDEHIDFYTCKPKSKKSHRIIAMPKQFKEIIDALYDEKFGNKKVLVSRKSHMNDFVFLMRSEKKGEHQLYTLLINNWLKSLVKRYNATAPEDAQLPEDISSHWMRHTFITRAIEGGATPQQLMAIVGHSNIQMIIRIYNHIQHDEIIKATSKIDDRYNKVIAG